MVILCWSTLQKIQISLKPQQLPSALSNVESWYDNVRSNKICLSIYDLHFSCWSNRCITNHKPSSIDVSSTCVMTIICLFFFMVCIAIETPVLQKVDFFLNIYIRNDFSYHTSILNILEKFQENNKYIWG